MIMEGSKTLLCSSKSQGHAKGFLRNMQTICVLVLRFASRGLDGLSKAVKYLNCYNLGLISSLMHKILVYLHIIHLLKSSTCFEHYPAHLQEVYVVIVYMQPLVSSPFAGDCLMHLLGKNLTGAQDSHLQRVTIPEAVYIQLRRRPPEDEQGNAPNMQRILINVLYVNKQEFCASSWRSNQGYTMMHVQPIIKINCYSWPRA